MRAAATQDAATRKFRAARAAHDQLLKHAEVLSYDAEDRRFIEQTIRELVRGAVCRFVIMLEVVATISMNSVARSTRCASRRRCEREFSHTEGGAAGTETRGV